MEQSNKTLQDLFNDAHFSFLYAFQNFDEVSALTFTSNRQQTGHAFVYKSEFSEKPSKLFSVHKTWIQNHLNSSR